MSRSNQLRRRIRKRDGHEAEVCPWCERRFAEIEPQMMSQGPCWPAKAVVITFEHTVGQQDGSTWNVGNIVLACIWCNQRRERLAHLGVQDEDRVIAKMQMAARVNISRAERRQDLGFLRIGSGWGRGKG